MKKVKIMRIIARLNIGGPAIHTVLLTEGLDKNKFTSLLACGSLSKDEGDMSYYAEEKNVTPYFIPELKRELNFHNDSIALKKIYQLITRENPDIIHTHTAKAGTLGRTAGIIRNIFLPPGRKIKLIHTFHGHALNGYFNTVKNKIFILIERVLAFFSDRIITVSESVKEELIRLKIAGENKITVIPLGFELEKFLKSSCKNKRDFFHIGIVGRLVPIKNHRLFLEAAAKLIDYAPQVKLRFKIIGDGELKKELLEYSSRLKIDKFVDFLGWSKNLVEVYEDLDILTLTSDNEGTPVSLIEAMACAKPVIATEVGGVADLLGKELEKEPDRNFKIRENGISIPTKSPDPLASALIFAIENPQKREEWGINARNFVKDTFTKERLLKDIETLYGKVLNV